MWPSELTNLRKDVFGVCLSFAGLRTGASEVSDSSDSEYVTSVMAYERWYESDGFVDDLRGERTRSAMKIFNSSYSFHGI